MRVPGCSGRNVLRMMIGSPRSTAGAIVLGWMTFAPKYASSIASLYDSASSVTASGTRRGFALITPSTSVQIWISSASRSAANIDALKSLPFRPSVVATPSDVDATNPVTTSVRTTARLTTDSTHPCEPARPPTQLMEPQRRVRRRVRRARSASRPTHAARPDAP